MRLTLSALLILYTAYGFAQRIMLTGSVKDDTGTLLVGTHVRNISIDKITISNMEGRFLLPAQPGDTLLLSNIGYAQLTYTVKISDFVKEPTLTMRPSTTSLDEVTILSIPTLKRFKEMVMEETVKDTVEFW